MSSKYEADRVYKPIGFTKQKYVVQRLLQYVKNKWFKAKAAEIELKMNRSNDVINDEILEGDRNQSN